ncbi:agmatinase [Kiritimatiella glycovorans]|uniref:Agmatinase n=1 Tax=Kiritimatiella glycovorans TaxID=1307763 RepID=A0A0G3EE26_9BACT|nr:agmatinase [Kiritimatiella glycovorans]AKJ64711.1 Agmatinase [Kiritimatiella glycovorans]
MSREIPDFLESELSPRPAEQCLFHVIPAPLEETVSYGGGTRNGPEAILRASTQLEAFDEGLCACERGIHTAAAAGDPDAVRRTAAKALRCGAVPVLLGGEHSATLAPLKALRDEGVSFGLVQFDAHADLRDCYEGRRDSHACVMRRAIEDLDLPLFQIGVRAMSPGEHELRRERAIPHLDAESIAAGGVPAPLLPATFPGHVYITFDVDALDPSLMPATGTPEPGGLDWWTARRLIRAVTAGRRVVGIDVVELAPIPGMHAPDFTAARLTYALITAAADNA